MTRLLTIWLIACGGATTSSGPANTGSATTVPLPADGALGWLALAPQPIDVQATWIPAGNFAALVPDGGPVKGGRAFDAAGGTTYLEPIGASKTKYGCDNNMLDVTLLATTDTLRLAPGPVWITPAGIDQPKALPIRPEISTPSKLHYAIGPLTIDLRTTGDETGTMAIGWHGHPVHDDAFKRVLMAGADNAPIRLNDPGEVAVPQPIAAWSFARAQVALVVFRTPGYEGSNIEAMVVGDSAARKVEPMTMYLYYCAF